jgi:hypothetical protein
MKEEWVQALFSPDAFRPFNKPFVPLKLDSKSWEPCPFNKVPDCSQVQTSNILSIQEKGT